MARGSKDAYTSKQKRQAEHIEEGYEARGLGEGEAERRAWATVNKVTGGGKKAGSGRGKVVDKSPMTRGGKKKASTGKKKASTGRKKASTGKKKARKSTAGVSKKRASASKKKAGISKKDTKKKKTTNAAARKS